MILKGLCSLRFSYPGKTCVVSVNEIVIPHAHSNAGQ